jgi:SAM-dependent methyltransferase
MASSRPLPRAYVHTLTQRFLETRMGDLVLALWNRSPIQGYLGSADVRRLHLGCGQRLLPGWLNADLPSIRRLVAFDHSIVAVNANRPLPFEDETFDRVYTEHMHEHLDYASGLALLKEIRRVLKPNGRLRLALPDLEFHIAMIVSDDTFVEFPAMFADAMNATDGLAGAPPSKNTFLNFLFRGSEHKYLYSRPELKNQLENAGFVSVRFMAPGESSDPHLRALETNPLNRTEDQVRLHVRMTMAIEAEVNNLHRM